MNNGDAPSSQNRAAVAKWSDASYPVERIAQIFQHDANVASTFADSEANMR